MKTFRQYSQLNHIPYNRTRCVYDIDTPDEIVAILEKLIHSDKRIRVFYGDTNRADFESVHGRTPNIGEDWGEENDVVGYVGKSTGAYPIPLLIKNNRSLGGGGFLDSCIVRILINGKEVYRHPNYYNRYDKAEVKLSDIPQYSHMVVTERGIEARFKSEKSAKNWLKFMCGERMCK